jgi:predicted peptidase
MSQQAKSFRQRIARTVHCRYLLHVPAGYARSRTRWPLLLFLHGAGERGNDLALVKKHGPPKFVDDDPDFPFLMVSPQCPADQWWDVEVLAALLDSVTKRYRVDPKRLYVTGLSMGGYGTWALALHQPKRFAAIAPVCGGGNRLLAKRIAHLPVWAFHGAEDDVVPLDQSEKMIQALRAAGSAPKFTVYPDAGHDSWTETYANRELYEWLLRQTRR